MSEGPLSAVAAIGLLEIFLYLATSLTMPWWAYCLILIVMWALLAVFILRSPWTVKTPLLVKAIASLGAMLFVWTLGSKTVRQAYREAHTSAVILPATSATPIPMSKSLGSLPNPDTVFKEEPDIFPTITLGCGHITPDGPMLPSMERGAHEPFLKILGPERGQYAIPITLYLVNRTLYADVEIYSPKMGSAFTLKGNKFVVSGPDWDANHNDWALELINDDDVPVFQMIRESRMSLRIYALFERFNVALGYTPRGFGRIVGPDGTFVDGTFVPPKDFLRPLFKHPGRDYPGQLITDTNSPCPPEAKGRFSMVSGPLVIGP